MSARRPLRPAVLVGALALLGACAPRAERADEPPTRAPAVEVLGKAVPCILLAPLLQTIVHDDRTVDFRLAGGRLYRNTLPLRCFSLGFQGSFTYEATSGQLCAVDTISVLQQDRTRAIPCPLGEFVPVRLARRED